MKRIINWLVGLIIVATVVGTFTGAMFAGMVDFNKTIEPEFNASFTSIAETFNETQRLSESINTQGAQGEGITTALSTSSIPTGVLSAIRSVFGSITTAQILTREIFTMFDIPIRVYHAIIAILILTITLTILAVMIDR